MKFSEQMTLIAKGYSKKEIDELKKLEAEEIAAAAAAEEEQKQEPDQKEEADDTTKEEPDYKNLYTELHEKYTKLEKDMKDIQKANTKANAAPAAGNDINEEDTLINIARQFM